jgi:hypothetical protein
MGESRKQFNLRLPPEEYDAIVAVTQRGSEPRTITAFMRAAIRAHLARYNALPELQPAEVRDGK